MEAQLAPNSLPFLAGWGSKALLWWLLILNIAKGSCKVIFEIAWKAFL